MDLTTNYLGLSLRSPLVPSASPLSEKIENIRAMEQAGAAAVIFHSLFEEQIEATERIEITKVGAIGGDPLVIPRVQHLRSAQRVLDGLTDNPRESQAEKFVRTHVEKPHGLPLHWINETNAIGKFAAARDECVVKLRKFLRRSRQIRVKNHENIARRNRKCLSNGVAFTNAGLL